MYRSKKLTTIIIILLLVNLVLAILELARSLRDKPSQLKVVPAYEGQARYIAAVQAEPQADRDVLYQKYVTDVYQEACGGNGLINTSETTAFEAQHPLGNLDVFAEEVRTLVESNTKQTAEKVLKQSWKLLPGTKITACIFALDPIQEFPGLNSMHGIWGGTYGPGLFLIEIMPKESWLDWLPYTMAHEYHHTVFSQNFRRLSSDPMDLLEVLIVEGRADSFARILYPNLEPLWTKALTPEQEATQWQLMQDELDSTSDLQRFMFGDSQIPWWTGYTIGFHIVQKYLQGHPNASIEEWTEMNEHELLEQSGYAGQP